MSHLLIRSLRCEPTARRPLWLMRQAGRFLPEYRALRERHGFEELCAAPDLAAEITLMPLRRFPLDAAIVFADIMSPVKALGIKVRFAPGPQVSEPLRTATAIHGLPEPAPEEIAPEVMETLRQVCARLDGRAALIGFAPGPWTLAAYLVEGKGSKDGFPRLRAMVAGQPALLNELLRRLANLLADYLVQQVHAGAHVIQVFETWSGVLAAEHWIALVKPHLSAVLHKVETTGVPRILFIKDAPQLLPAILDLPVEAFSLDWRVDLAAFREQVPSCAIQGNLDPAVLLAGPEATANATRELLRRVPACGHVVSLGHGVLPETPLESVAALVDVVHEAGGAS